MASVGEQLVSSAPKDQFMLHLEDSIIRLERWLEANDYKAYDPFDGLNATQVPGFIHSHWLPRMALQQGVRRCPINLRPLLGVAKSRSTKGMGFIAKGYIRLHEATGQNDWRRKAESVLQWLIDNSSPDYSGASWGNHFDYQSRGGFMPKGTPTVVWTSLIGHAFFDAYQRFQDDAFLQVAYRACQHIVQDLNRISEGDVYCISYTPKGNLAVHNSNTLGASLLARAYTHTGDQTFREIAEKAIHYTVRHQRPNGSWYYAEAKKYHWVDNFHTAYVLDSLKYYVDAIRDQRVEAALARGYQYWKETFFLSDGTPRYYDHKTLPLDIQCASQAIDSLVLFQDRDPSSLDLAGKVASWTIDHMQDRAGFFYYRRYSKWIVNRTPTLHWGQATMLSALAGLYRELLRVKRVTECAES